MHVPLEGGEGRKDRYLDDAFVIADKNRRTLHEHTAGPRVPGSRATNVANIIGYELEQSD